MRKRMAILLACLLFLSGCGQEQNKREKVSLTSGTVQGDEENIGEGFEMVSSTDYNNYGCGDGGADFIRSFPMKTSLKI